jgi:hypothetical protein
LESSRTALIKLNSLPSCTMVIRHSVIAVIMLGRSCLSYARTVSKYVSVIFGQFETNVLISWAICRKSPFHCEA